jgi:hypothetical protein
MRFIKGLANAAIQIIKENKTMGKVSVVQKQLMRLIKAKSEATESLAKIEADMESIRQDLGVAIARGNVVDDLESRLNDAREVHERAELILAAVDGEVVQTKKKLDEALDLEYKADLAARRAEVKAKLVELVKAIQSTHNLAADISGMRQRYNAQLQVDFGRKGLSFMGVPVDDVLLRSHYWLGGSSVIGNHELKELLTEAGIASSIERKKYVKAQLKDNHA